MREAVPTQEENICSARRWSVPGMANGKGSRKTTGELLLVGIENTDADGPVAGLSKRETQDSPGMECSLSRQKIQPPAFPVEKVLGWELMSPDEGHCQTELDAPMLCFGIRQPPIFVSEVPSWFPSFWKGQPLI